MDFLWFLWAGRNSPIFGRDRMTTFGRRLRERIDDLRELLAAFRAGAVTEDHTSAAGRADHYLSPSGEITS